MQLTAGVIIAGGKGSRIGGDKPLQPFGDGVLLDAVIAAVNRQVDVLALNIPAISRLSYERYANSYPLIMDSLESDTGPLAGIVAALEWASSLEDMDWVATFPCDTPFLPGNLTERLRNASQKDRPAVAEDAARLHGLCALWPISCLDRLRADVESGRLRSLHAAHDALDSVRVRFENNDAFFNVNTADDLQLAADRQRSASAQALSARATLPKPAD